MACASLSKIRRSKTGNHATLSQKIPKYVWDENEWVWEMKKWCEREVGDDKNEKKLKKLYRKFEAAKS